MSGLVDRWGRTGFALVSSLVWALPMAAWAGSVDLVSGPGPWLAFAVGALLLVAWLVLLTQLARIPVTTRPRRFDVTAMSAAERRWNLALAVFGIGLIGWLNGAATVEWSSLTSSVAAGRSGSLLLALGLAIFLAAMVAGVALSWRRSSVAFRERAAA